MTVHVALEHLTSYGYDRPVRLSPHLVRLRPSPHARAAVLDHQQVVRPATHTVSWQQDVFGNHVARYVFAAPTDELEIDVRTTLALEPVNPFDFLLEPGAESWPVPYEPAVARALLPSLSIPEPSRLEHEFLAAARSVAQEGRPTTDVLIGLNRLVHEAIGYETRLEQGVQTPTETLDRRRGSCRDLVWLLVHVLRALGLAARFTSGYLVELADDAWGTAAGDDEEPVHDRVELHAWADVHVPGAGWVGLDPTSGLLAAEGHVPLATATEPELAAPVTGTTSPATVDFSHRSSVRRLDPPAGSTS